MIRSPQPRPRPAAPAHQPHRLPPRLTTPRLLPLAALLLAGVVLLTLPAAGADAQEILHNSRCYPAGSDSYPVGDSIQFIHRPPSPEPPPPLPKLPAVPYPPCVDVTLSANDVGGDTATMTIGWRTDGREIDGTPKELAWSGNPVTVDTGDLQDGVNTITLTVANFAGEAVEAVNLWVPRLTGPIPAPIATVDPADPLKVQLTVRAPGAYTWEWDFGDGTGTPPTVFCDFATSTVTHTFAQAGTYLVTAKASNCRVDSPVVSEPLEITVGGG